MENVVVRERLAKLRAAMQAHQMDFYLIPTADYHHSEYVDGFFKAREYFSEFEKLMAYYRCAIMEIETKSVLSHECMKITKYTQILSIKKKKI